MTEILITSGFSLLAAFTASILSYKAAVYNSNKQFEGILQNHTTEIERIKEQAKLDRQKMEEEFKKQAELYERNAQTDIAKDFMSDLMTSEEGRGLFTEILKQGFKAQRN
ncbi:hypothetical protein ACV1QZ_06455 [Bacillus subtilis]|uniref:hypothetical protein n=1 Tax=Bacillus subtilis group TaxID=653685 RepID=UPI0024C022B6|nr:hypothetical protein [Bacillus subtilis]MDK1002626.1 hypothetical protein [Bacillus subtilis]